MERKNFTIINDEDTFNLRIIQDEFRTEEEAKKYMKENNLDDENHFVAEFEI